MELSKQAKYCFILPNNAFICKCFNQLTGEHNAKKNFKRISFCGSISLHKKMIVFYKIQLMYYKYRSTTCSSNEIRPRRFHLETNRLRKVGCYPSILGLYLVFLVDYRSSSHVYFDIGLPVQLLGIFPKVLGISDHL